MEEELIDNETNSPSEASLKSIIFWWEKRRLLFNGLILSVALIVSILHVLYMPHESHTECFNYDFFERTLLYLLFINVCYCAGWFIQMIFYGFEIQSGMNVLRIVLFVVGTLFTAYVTFFGYSSYLGLTRYF